VGTINHFFALSRPALPSVTFRRNGAGRFRRNDATGNEQLEGSNGDQGCLILPPFASSVLGDSTPGFSPR